MQFIVIYENGVSDYTFPGNFTKNFKISNTTQVAAIDVEFGKADFDYLKVVRSDKKEMFIPKSRVVSVELNK